MSKPRKPRNPEENKAQWTKAHCRDAKDAVRHSSNDISWYNSNPQLLKDAASLSYAEALGLKTDFGGTSPNGYRISGIARIGLAPAFGVSEDGSSVLNVAARRLYAYVRHANSGSRNYEAADLTTYVLAMSSVYSTYVELARLYGTTRLYSRVNRYVAKGLVTSMGYDYDDIVSNLAQLRYTINNFAVRVNSLCVPKDLKIFARHAFIPSAIFKDSDEDKAGLYFMQFNKYFQWNGTKYNTGSALIMKDTPWAVQVMDNHLQQPTPTATGMKYQDIVDFTDSLIKDLMTNEDIGIMSGDIKKAFGDNLYMLTGIPEEYATPVIYDEMILAQIHNANVVGRVITESDGTNPGDLDYANVRQISGQLIFNPYTKGAGILRPTNPTNINQVLDCGFNAPTPEYNMEATRLKSRVDVNYTVDLGTQSSGGTGGNTN